MFALEKAPLDADLARLAALEREVRERDRELDCSKRELQALQTRYLTEVGGLYATLSEIEAAIAEIEIAVGLREPPADQVVDGQTGDSSADGLHQASCDHRDAASDDLKRIFRRIARTIHPDLALDAAAWYRRHSLMAEANRAYAERDEDRLRLILHTWELGDDTELAGDDGTRVQRRLAALEHHYGALEREMEDLRGSAIWRLRDRIEDAKRQGWDLFAEMVREVEREIRRATARLAKLRASFGVQVKA
jgi:hypothetical protein